MFGPTLLSEAETADAVHTSGRALVVRVRPEWAAPGEHRIGYATQVRLVECVRELHWRLDVAADATVVAPDQITRSLSLDFRAPVTVHADVLGTYSVLRVSQRSYTLAITLADFNSGQALTHAELISVFYDPVANRSVACSTRVRNCLLQSRGDDVAAFTAAGLSDVEIETDYEPDRDRSIGVRSHR